LYESYKVLAGAKRLLANFGHLGFAA
jgi:hypothetical protein